MPEEILLKTTPYKFEGFFNPKEMFSFINSCFEELGYRLNEKEFEESTKADTKKIKVKYDAEKPLTDYFLAKIKYSVDVSGKKVIIEDNGKTKEVYEGKLKFMIQGILVQDFMNKIEKTPIGKFLSQVYNKYIGIEEREKVEGIVKGDAKNIIKRIKQYLNSDV